MRLIRSRHGLVRFVAIVGTGALLVCGVLYMNSRDREAISRKSSARDLQQIKVALDRYVRAHDGRYPPRLEVRAELGLVQDREVLAGVSFPSAGKQQAELKSSDYVVVQPERRWSENTPARFALRADGRIEYSRE